MAVAVRSDAQSTEANTASCVIPKPTGLTAGDLMIAHVVIRTDKTVTNPSGWTSIRTDTISGVLTQRLAWKIATSGDVSASDFTFTWTGSSPNLGSITAFTGHDATTPIGANNGTATASNSTTISSAAITPAVANSMICFFCTYGGSNGGPTISGYTIATSAPTFTEQYDTFTELGNDISYSMACGVRAATTSTGTGTATADISRNNIGALVAISEAAAGTTISIPKGEIQVAKLTPTVAATANVFIAVPRGQIQVQARTPTVKLNTKIAVPLGQIQANPKTPTIVVTANQFVAVPRGQITVTGQTPAVATTANVRISVPKGSINVQGYAPDVVTSQDIIIESPKGSIDVQAYAPTVVARDNKFVAVPKGEISVSAYTPTVKLNTIIQSPKGSINVQGYAPIIVTGGPQFVNVPQGQIVVTGYAPTVNAGGSGNSGLTMMGIGS